jgi:hypothetical protein
VVGGTLEVMRLYVLCLGNVPADDSYIVAEVTRVPGQTKSDSLAGAVAGAHSSVLSRDELMQTTDGALALSRWDHRDDSVFDRETVVLARTSRRSGRTRLRVIGPNDQK